MRYRRRSAWRDDRGLMLCLYCAVVDRDAVGANYTLIAVEAQPAKIAFILGRELGSTGNLSVRAMLGN